MTKNKTRGSVLIFILLAVALLGALTVILSRTSSNTEETGSKERASIEASQILSNNSSLKSTVERLKLNGCSEFQISFNGALNADGTESLTGTNYNSNSPADFSCHIYHVNGGGQKKKIDNSVWQNSIHSVGTTLPDLYMYQRNDTNNLSITSDICDDLNKKIGNNISISSLPIASLSTGLFSGNPNQAFLVLGDNGAETGMAGIKSACITDTDCGGSACFAYYSVLISR